MKAPERNKLVRNANRGLRVFNGYFTEIPLDRIFATVKQFTGATPLDIDGTPWSGILCGAEGYTYIDLGADFPRNKLYVYWYKMAVSGKYEVNTYITS